MTDPQRCVCGTRGSRRCQGYKAYTDGYCRACGHSRACCSGSHRERRLKKPQARATAAAPQPVRAMPASLAA